MDDSNKFYVYKNCIIPGSFPFYDKDKDQAFLLHYFVLMCPNKNWYQDSLSKRLQNNKHSFKLLRYLTLSYRSHNTVCQLWSPITHEHDRIRNFVFLKVDEILSKLKGFIHDKKEFFF